MSIPARQADELTERTIVSSVRQAARLPRVIPIALTAIALAVVVGVGHAQRAAEPPPLGKEHAAPAPSQSRVNPDAVQLTAFFLSIYKAPTPQAPSTAAEHDQLLGRRSANSFLTASMCDVGRIRGRSEEAPSGYYQCEFSLTAGRDSSISLLQRVADLIQQSDPSHCPFDTLSEGELRQRLLVSYTVDDPFRLVRGPDDRVERVVANGACRARHRHVALALVSRFPAGYRDPVSYMTLVVFPIAAARPAPPKPIAHSNVEDDVAGAIARIRGRPYGPMPSASSESGLSGSSALTLKNETPYTMHVYLDGPTRRSLIILAGKSVTIDLDPGQYEEAVEVLGGEVTPFYGVHQQSPNVSYVVRFFLIG